MTQIKIRVLKGLCRFEIFSQIKYRFFFRNMSPLYTTASKKIVSVPGDISALNLIVGLKLFAFKRNSSILSLFVSHFVQGHPDDRYLSNAVLSMWSTFKVL